jgi:hypothetical protein
MLHVVVSKFLGAGGRCLCLVSTWLCISFRFSRVHNFKVLGKCVGALGHMQGPSSGNGIMVVPAPCEVPIQNCDGSPH